MRLRRLPPAHAILACAVAASSTFAAARTPRVGAGTSATLTILETTDLHANVLGYDYFRLAPDPSLGLDRAATLIEAARAEFPDTLLFDDGDTLQGTALGDYQGTVEPPRCGALPAIVGAMRRLGYDGATVGNHDFDYGLPYLAQASGRKRGCAGPGFPVVLANVLDARTGRPVLPPYAIIDKRVHAADAHGRPVAATVRIGIIGFTPPTIMAWDRRWLEGRVTTTGIVEAARRYLPEMRARGADVVVALSHGGLDGRPYAPGMENGNYYLAQVAGIDALLLGHAHGVFPDAASKLPGTDLPQVDKANGRVFGVPTVMAGLWGRNLGIVRLPLVHDGRRWRVDRANATVLTRATRQGDRFVAPDADVVAGARDAHEATIAWVRTPVGETDFRMATYFADVGDASAVQVVNDAQKAWAAAYIGANLPHEAHLPLLSLAAPFKSGGAGPADYTDVAPGSLALNDAAALYPYPNTLSVVKVDGAGLKAWLERAALRFNTIDPEQTAPQELVNASFAGYNFDMATDKDLRYEIDVTQPPGRRIRNLAWRGVPVADGQAFLVATNNYRASGGGGFPGLGADNTVLSAPDMNRAVLLDSIRARQRLSRERDGAVRSWRFAPVTTRGQVWFRSAPGKLALARAAGLENVSLAREDDGKGYAVYAVDLSR